MDLTPILLNAQSMDPQVRPKAEEQLRQAELANYPVFLVSLVFELGNNEKPPQSRQMAGLILKNQLASKDEARARLLAQQWTALPPDTKAEIRKTVLATLGSATKEARHTAAQVLAKIASIEIPQNQWLEVIQVLVSNVTNPTSDEQKEASLEALGYICEESDSEVLAQQSNAILTAVIQGMRKEEPNNAVRLAATTALNNALEFVHQNFDRPNERDFVMQVVCETTQSTDVRVREAAFECLVKIAALYYDKLKPYMEALFNLTVSAAKSDVDIVGQQAIEFWSTMCDVELEIMEEVDVATSNGEKPERTCENYVKAALPHLVPLLCHTLTRQEEDQEDDDWNVSTAAGTCLDLVARTVGDEIVNYAMPFISQNINNPDWHFREAATLAFGSILEGPSSDILTPLIDQAVPIMLTHMKDPITLVKDTTAWTLGRIAELHSEPIIDKYLQPVLQAMLEALSDQARVASKACWTIHNVASAFEEDDEAQTTALTPFFAALAKQILETTERDDAMESNLRSSAYEALNALLQTAAQESLPLINQIVPVLLDRLQQTIVTGTLDPEELQEKGLVQGLLCGAIQVVTRKLGKNIEPSAPRIMELFLALFNTQNVTVHEEALMAIGALANAIETSFATFMPAFSQYLFRALRNVEEDSVISIAVGVIADICGALGPQVEPYCDELVRILLDDLRAEQLNRNVKPAMFACFGDIALAIGGKFEKYLPYVCQLLQQASQTQVDPEDEELVDYLNHLRENIFEAYTGILQGLKTDNAAAFHPYVDGLVAFIRLVASDEKIDETVFRNAVGVIGDLANVYGAKIRPVLSQDFVNRMVTEAAKSDDEQTKETGEWAKKMLKSMH